MKKLNAWRERRKNKKDERSDLAISVDRYMWILGVLLFVPYLIEKVWQRYGTWPFLNITSADWLAYGGVLIGAFFTIWALVTTINDNRAVAEAQERANHKQMLEEDRLNNKPLLHLVCRKLRNEEYSYLSETEIPEEIGKSLLMLYSLEEFRERSRETIEGTFVFSLHNVGKGPAIGINAIVTEPNHKNSGILFDDVLPTSSSNKMITTVSTMAKKDLKGKHHVQRFALTFTYSDLSGVEYGYNAIIAFTISDDPNNNVIVVVDSKNYIV